MRKNQIVLLFSQVVNLVLGGFFLFTILPAVTQFQQRRQKLPRPAPMVPRLGK